MNFFDAITITDFRAAAKDHAASIVSSNSVQDIADAFIGGEYDSIACYFHDCHSNYTCYSPFEVIASRINGVNEADEVWQAIEDVLGEEFAKAEEELKSSLIRELEERKVDLEDELSQETNDNLEAYDELLDDCNDVVRIVNLELMPSDVLKNTDPVAYREGFLEWINFRLEDNEQLESIVDAIDNAKRL